MKNFKFIKARHWAWVHVLAAVGLWWPLYVIFAPPEFLREAVNPAVLIFCMVVAAFGSSVKIAGYLMSQMPDRLGVIGVSIELAGLVLAAIGPLMYLGVSIYAMTNPSIEFTFGSAFIFAYALCAVYLYRAIIIVPRFQFEAHDEAKDIVLLEDRGTH